MLNKHYTSKGFSLVEMMIAMALSAFIIAGILAVYISSKDTYALRDQISELDENARIAMKALREAIGQAGYASNTGIALGEYILPTNANPSAVACPNGNTSIVKVANITNSRDALTVTQFDNASSTATIGGDSIGVAFLADEQVFKDCTGSSWINRCLPTNNTNIALANRQARLIYSSFRVRASTRRNNAGGVIPELVCGGSLNSLTQPWAQGIENIQIRYGVDITPDPIPVGQKKQWQVDKYWTATEVSNNNAWDKIALVQIALLARTVEPVFKADETQTYQLFDRSVSITDRYRRAVYTTTVSLRNIAR